MKFTVSGDREIPLLRHRHGEAFGEGFGSIQACPQSWGMLSKPQGGQQQHHPPPAPLSQSPLAQSPIPPGRFTLPEILSLFFDPCGPLLQGLVTSCTKKNPSRRFSKAPACLPWVPARSEAWKALSNFPLLTFSRAPLMYI